MKYFAYGLHIDSSLDLPELLADTDPLQNRDLVISRASALVESELPFHVLDSKSWLLTIKDVAQFLISDGKEITYYPLSENQESTIRLYLLGSCMSAILYQRGFIVLHGNCLTHDGITCRIIVGDRGAGKSTTSAHFLNRGQKLLADDVTAVSWDAKGNPIVIPGFPRVKLWADSLRLLGIGNHTLSKIREEDEKYSLPLTDNFHATPLPLTEVICLSTGADTQLTGIKKWNALKQNDFRTKFLRRSGLFGAYCQQLTQLADKITVRTQRRPVLCPEPLK